MECLVTSCNIYYYLLFTLYIPYNIPYKYYNYIFCIVLSTSLIIYDNNEFGGSLANVILLLKTFLRKFLN